MFSVPWVCLDDVPTLISDELDGCLGQNSGETFAAIGAPDDEASQRPHVFDVEICLEETRIGQTRELTARPDAAPGDRIVLGVGDEAGWRSGLHEGRKR